jgi:transcriptional regulator with PAS, ATPase and Fis domain
MADESNQPEQTYDKERAKRLEDLLRALASRILELDAEGRLLSQAGELMRLIGDAKSELFHYEVRATYDTPEIAESRRIVQDAQETNTDKAKWDRTEWNPDEGGEPEW